jgi:hypothetical protein
MKSELPVSNSYLSMWILSQVSMVCCTALSGQIPCYRPIPRESNKLETIHSCRNSFIIIDSNNLRVMDG